MLICTCFSYEEPPVLVLKTKFQWSIMDDLKINFLCSFTECKNLLHFIFSFFCPWYLVGTWTFLFLKHPSQNGGKSMVVNMPSNYTKSIRLCLSVFLSCDWLSIFEHQNLVLLIFKIQLCFCLCDPQGWSFKYPNFISFCYLPHDYSINYYNSNAFPGEQCFVFRKFLMEPNWWLFTRFSCRKVVIIPRKI